MRKCDVRGDTNFIGSDSSEPTVYSLYCGRVSAQLIMKPGLNRFGLIKN